MTWEKLTELVGPPGNDGTHSFADLSRAAVALGLHPVGLKATRSALNGLPLPAIVQVHDPSHPNVPPHLLVLVRPESDGVTLLDPPFPPYFLPASRFDDSWTGNVLVFAEDAVEARRILNEARTNQLLRIALWVGLGLAALACLVLVCRLPLRGTVRPFARLSPRSMAFLLGVVCLTAGITSVGHIYRRYWSAADAPARLAPAAPA